MNGAASARATRASTMSAPKAPSGFRRASAHSLPGAPPGWGRAAHGTLATSCCSRSIDFPLGESNARVEPGVEQVHDQVDDQEDRREQDHDPLEQRVVALGDRAEYEQAQPRQDEDLLEDDRAA